MSKTTYLKPRAKKSLLESEEVIEPAPKIERYLSPLRYPGGKQRLGPFFRALIRDVYKKKPYYIEPFAGGAGVALYLLAGSIVNGVHLNDVDRSIYSLWHSMLNNRSRLLDMIRRRRISVAEWDRQKEVQRYKADATLLELGFSTLFLNRTNRSGILRAGMIGGRDQSRDWKLNARFNKKEIIRRIEYVGSHARLISISNEDCRKIRDLRFSRRTNALVYLDPPYYEKGQDLYINHFTQDDHETLSNNVRKISSHWVVSYDNVRPVRALYKDCPTYAYSLSYSADSYRLGSERIFLSPGLVRLPIRTANELQF